MITTHPSDSAIQQYAIDKLNCEKAIVDHVKVCDTCNRKVASYQLLFSEIRRLSKPAFDFDLAGLILSQLANPKPARNRGFFTIFWIFMAGISSIGISAYFFRENLLRIFSGIFPLFIYLIITAALSIIIFQAIEIYRTYHRQIKHLNFN